jgi:hypothetical protein
MEEVAAEGDALPQIPGWLERAARWARRHPAAVALLIAALLMLAAVIAAAMR